MATKRPKAAKKKQPAPPAPPPQPKREDVWLSRHQLAQVLGTSVRAFDELVATRINDAAVRGTNRTREYDAQVVIAAWVDSRVELATRGGSDGDLAAGAGDTSPALEQYRLAKARLAELDLAERTGKSVPVSELEQPLSLFSSLIRRAGETLQRQFGVDAAELLNDAITEAEEHWAAWQRDTQRRNARRAAGAAGGQEPHAASPDDQ